jgi:hypothetical protein
MKKFTQTLITTMGVLVASAVMALAGDSFKGNQLTQGYTPWYEKAAEVVKAPELKAKGGVVLTLQTGSLLYLEGDSTLHKYQMKANKLGGAAAVAKGDLAKALKSGQVSAMTLVIPVNDLKSKEKGLDENAYKALNVKDNPEIKFDLKSETLKAGKEAGSYTMTAKGNLTISGVSQPVVLTAETTLKDGKVRLKGVQKLKMSDYKVKPPSISLLVASITCSDEIAIHYDVTFAVK